MPLTQVAHCAQLVRPHAGVVMYASNECHMEFACNFMEMQRAAFLNK